MTLKNVGILAFVVLAVVVVTVSLAYAFPVFSSICSFFVILLSSVLIFDKNYRRPLSGLLSERHVLIASISMLLLATLALSAGVRGWRNAWVAAEEIRAKEAAADRAKTEVAGHLKAARTALERGDRKGAEDILLKAVSVPGAPNHSDAETMLRVCRTETARQEVEALLSEARRAVRRNLIPDAITILRKATSLQNAPNRRESEELLHQCELVQSDSKMAKAFADWNDVDFQTFIKDGSVPFGSYFDDPALNTAFVSRLINHRADALKMRTEEIVAREAKRREERLRVEKAAYEKSVKDQIEADEKKFQSEAGPKPSEVEVRLYVAENFHDPNVEYLGWSKFAPFTYVDGKSAWAVRVKFRARNGFNAWRLENKMFIIRHGRVIRMTDLAE